MEASQAILLFDFEVEPGGLRIGVQRGVLAADGSGMIDVLLTDEDALDAIIDRAQHDLERLRQDAKRAWASSASPHWEEHGPRMALEARPRASDAGHVAARRVPALFDGERP